MSTSPFTDDAMTETGMKEAAGPSCAEGQGEDGPAFARATQNLDARGLGLLGWRGGPGEEPAARLGLSWEDLLAEGWEIDCSTDPAADESPEPDERYGPHYSPVLRLIATLQDAFTN